MTFREHTVDHLRVAYADADPPAAMRGDCRLAGAVLGLTGAAEGIDLRAAYRGKRKPAITVDEAAYRLAAGLYLGHSD